MATLPNCLGNVCSVKNKFVIEDFDATHYSLDKPASSTIKLKQAAFRKFEISKSRYAKEMRKKFEEEARKDLQFDLGDNRKGPEKIIKFKICGDKKCECVAGQPAKGKSISINYNCLYAGGGQSFIVYGTVKYRLDTIMSVCNLKTDALFANFSTFSPEIDPELQRDLQISTDLRLNEAQNINLRERKNVFRT
ncbi:MAG: hypothetical protein H6936_14235 [Burkholderiales bacterium]|nr:hypothetical protein [Nitrosomonas sp.]MCP5275976.1 hypothetical protein [Burkholderiales bacterium]